ncbi:hypothetical protein KV112_14645 [Mycolicibacter sp. MYC123]|uniref:Uncharacterized protein n=1 Tax=[Mycobacterium] zoologicum TaxID=2872311 RepID=A0ABU5YLN9_9MYCO|nr:MULTISPECIES: hypothetical protein [unclassified Mycolicibacter]MEB3050960.1 hypothetical protein [Mycolicibacter sp. MYC123]MEB3063907.1 hypothetical protein [Mycolicibacter sp. MYC101]
MIETSGRLRPICPPVIAVVSAHPAKATQSGKVSFHNPQATRSAS